MKKISGWFRHHSLRSKLLGAILLIIIVMNLLTLLFTKITIYDELKEDIISDNRQRLQQIDKNLSYTMSQIGEDMMEIYEDINTKMIGKEDILNKHSVFSIQFVKYYLGLTRSMRSYSYIHSMMLFTKEGETYCQSMSNHLSFLDTDLYNKVYEEIKPDKLISWSGILAEDFYFRTEDGCELISAIIPIRQNYQTVAYFIVNVDVEQIRKFLTDSQEKEQVVIQLNEEDFIFEGSNTQEPGDEDIRELCADFNRDAFESMPGYYLFTEKIPATQWKISMIYSNTAARQSAMGMLFILMVSLACSGFSMIILGSFIVYEVTDPINRVTKDILRSEASGELTRISFEPKTNDEVAVLVLSYNKLVAKIQENMKRIEEEQRQNSSLYMMTLQMQINPHFLHNTLEALRYLVEMEDSRATEMIVAIGDFYKMSLMGMNDVTKLSDEYKHVESYLTIMKIRYPNKFDFEIDIDHSLMNNVAVKLTLQPLVENAIYHGVRQKHDRGHIYIHAYQDRENLLVEIYDNGIGISGERLEEIRQELDATEKIKRNCHIGLLNAHQRLQMHFGRDYGVRLESEPGKYTIVTMVLPYQEYKGDKTYV